MQIERERISYIIGERIREFRVLRGMSQEALAFASEINPTYLGRLERGEKCPTVDTLYKISLGLKLPLHELLDVSAALEPTQTEAMHRIKTAMEVQTNLFRIIIRYFIHMLLIITSERQSNLDYLNRIVPKNHKGDPLRR